MPLMKSKKYVSIPVEKGADANSSLSSVILRYSAPPPLTVMPKGQNILKGARFFLRFCP